MMRFGNSMQLVGNNIMYSLFYLSKCLYNFLKVKERMWACGFHQNTEGKAKYSDIFEFFVWVLLRLFSSILEILLNWLKN